MSRVPALLRRGADPVKRRLGAVTAGVASLLLAVTACSSPAEPDQQRIVDSDQYVALYREVVEDFPEELPEGIELPDEPPALEGDIGRGNAAGAAYFYWNCSWEDVYLNAPDADAKAKAMEQMRKLPSTDWALTYWTDPDGVWTKLLDAAELGDLTELRQFYESDCAFYRDTESEGANG